MLSCQTRVSRHACSLSFRVRVRWCEIFLLYDYIDRLFREFFPPISRFSTPLSTANRSAIQQALCASPPPPPSAPTSHQDVKPPQPLTGRSVGLDFESLTTLRPRKLQAMYWTILSVSIGRNSASQVISTTENFDCLLALYGVQSVWYGKRNERLSGALLSSLSADGLEHHIQDSST